MNQQRTNFTKDANRTVADALRHIRRVGELANRDVYRYTNSDVDEIVAALRAEVTRTSAKFMRGSSSPTARFRLSETGSLAPALPKRAEKWKFAYANLLRRRIIANARLRKIRSKPFASDAAADRLLRAITPQTNTKRSTTNTVARTSSPCQGADHVETTPTNTAVLPAGSSPISHSYWHWHSSLPRSLGGIPWMLRPVARPPPPPQQQRHCR